MIRFVRLLAVAALAAAAVCQRPALVVQNLSQARQQAWVFVGAPASQQPGTCKPQGWPAVAMPGGLAVQVDLPGGSRAEVGAVEVQQPHLDSAALAKPVPGIAKIANFASLRDLVVGPASAWSPWVFDEPARLVPHFLCWKDAWPYWSADPVIVSVEMLGPALRVFWRTRIVPPVDLTIEGWWTFWPGQDVVDLSLQAVWATTATTGMSADLGVLTLVIGERPVIDHAKRKGLPEQPSFYPEFFGGMWGQTLMTARAVGRASRIQWTGALLCLAAGERWSTPPSDARHANLQARLQGPLCAVSGAWAGSWGAFGELPVAPPGAAPRALSSNAADEYDQRPLANFKEAGTTGEQPDFGCCSRDGDPAVLLQPGAVFDALWQVQAWGLRPTSNREIDGRPVRAADHPRMVTYGQRPDVRLGQDLVGWDRVLPYYLPGSGYTGQDDQHRSDNLLVAMFQLTRNPAVGSVIADHLELDTRRYWSPDNAPIASPRDWGRTLLAWGAYSACGFEGARPLMLRSLGLLDQNASFRRIPQDSAHTVRVFSDNEGKYGWLIPGGTDPERDMVRSWNPWQEGICVEGEWAAWLQTGDTRARDAAITVAETIVRHAFSNASGQWRMAYACRWRTDDPGAPLPDEIYPIDGPTLDHYGYPIQRWCLGAVRIAQVNSTDEGVRARAAAELAAFPVVDWADAAWRAVRP